jgi:tRNA nucleotidyltransferase (CCA-adding enzyme)
MAATKSAQRAMQRLPQPMVRFLRRLGRLADVEGIGLYLVGGVVRDLLLRRRNWDLDLAVEGDGISFARLVTNRYGAGLALFERFATARLVLRNGLRVDIASTRRESYANPAALPDVRSASLGEDLFRRDFTINAMAIQLNSARWGQLHDPYGGEQDLKHKTLRVLHERSFVDDPTRIFRAIRFARRFGFRLEPNTERLLAQAASTNLVARLSGPRLANEIFALMKEPRPDLAIGRLRRLDVLRFLHPRLSPGIRAKRLMTVLPETMGWWKRHCPKESLNASLLGLMALLAESPASVISSISRRLQLSTAHSRALEWAGAKTSRISKTLSGDALLRPSQIYRLLADLPHEALALVLAKGWTTTKGGGTERLQWRLKKYLTRDRHVTTSINGETLKRLGLQPGPQFKRILERLLDERLDGRITAPAQEQHRARALAKHYGQRRYFRRRGSLSILPNRSLSAD